MRMSSPLAVYARMLSDVDVDGGVARARLSDGSSYRPLVERWVGPADAVDERLGGSNVIVIERGGRNARAQIAEPRDTRERKVDRDARTIRDRVRKRIRAGALAEEAPRRNLDRCGNQRYDRDDKDHRRARDRIRSER